jgi:hypothetical protein
VGASVGKRVRYEGAVEGSEDGKLVGMKLGLEEGAKVGSSEGSGDGSNGAGVTRRVGFSVGISVGNKVLFCVGRAEGRNVGTPVRPAASGAKEGAEVGLLDWTPTETIAMRPASAVEEVLVAGVPSTSCVALKLNVSKPLAASVAILSARAAADIPSLDDRTRMSMEMETLAALTFRT